MSSGAAAVASYVNPFGAPVTTGRVDQGVDYSGKPGTPIRAIGNAKIIGILSNWYAGQPLLWYELLDGPRKGQFIYNAEQLTPEVKPGQIVVAGQKIASIASSGTGLEFGFATKSGQTVAMATTGYTEGQATPAGNAFKVFESSLGRSPGSGGSILGTVGGALETAGGAVLNAPGQALGLAGEAAGAGASAIGEGLISWLKPIATKLTLYGALIFGAVAMIGYGLAQLLKPIAKPAGGAGASAIAKKVAENPELLAAA